MCFGRFHVLLERMLRIARTISIMLLDLPFGVIVLPRRVGLRKRRGDEASRDRRRRR